MARKLALATLILAGSNILSKVLGLLRDMVLARVGGTGWQVDAYNLAFTLPDLINHFLGAGLMSITLIPLLTPKLALFKDDSADAPTIPQESAGEALNDASRVIQNILLPIFILVLLVTAVCFVFMENIIPLLSDAPLTADVIDEAVRYTRILIFAQVSFVCGGFFLAFQYARFSYFLPALAPLVYNAGIILGGVLSLYLGDGSLDGFCWGVLIASIMGNFLMQYLGAWREGFRWIPKSISWWSEDLFRYLKLTLPFILAVGATFSSEFVYKYFAGGEEGNIATLGFGLRINMALVGVFGGAVGVAGYPYMAKLVHNSNWKELNLLMVDTIEKILVLLMPVCVITAALSEPLVKLYLGGGAFDSDSVMNVSEALRLYLWSAVPMSAMLIMSRAFYAKQDTWTPSLLTLGAFVISLPLYHLLEHLGMMRVPIVSSITVGLQFVALLVMWLTRHGEDVYKRLMFSILKLSVVVVPVYLLTHMMVLRFKFVEMSSWSLLLALPLLGGVALILSFGLIAPLQIQGYWQLIHKVWSRVSPHKSSHTV